jgi:chromosome segregation ATPase
MLTQQLEEATAALRTVADQQKQVFANMQLTHGAHQDEIADLKAKNAQLQQQHQRSFAAVEEELAALRAAAEEQQQVHQSLQEEIGMLRNNTTAAAAAVGADAGGALGELEGQLVALREELAAVTARAEQASECDSRSQEQVSELRQQLDDARRQLAELATATDARGPDASSSGLQQQQQEVDRALGVLHSGNDNVTDELDALRVKIVDLEQQCVHLLERAEAAESARAQLAAAMEATSQSPQAAAPVGGEGDSEGEEKVTSEHTRLIRQMFGTARVLAAAMRNTKASHTTMSALLASFDSAADQLRAAATTIADRTATAQLAAATAAPAMTASVTDEVPGATPPPLDELYWRQRVASLEAEVSAAAAAAAASEGQLQNLPSQV